MNEFELIKQYFAVEGYRRKDVILGIGDDAAVTHVPANQLLVTTTDTVVEGVHFLPSSDASSVAHKSVAVNLSDLAAMGAEPAWLSLSLSIPELSSDWLAEFSGKLRELSHYYAFELIGGDTVKGPLAITITAQGFVPKDNALKRSGAKTGDWIYVTGTLGDASVGLALLKNELTTTKEHTTYLINRHYLPTPRVLAGTAMRRLASSCIDVSDGLMQDLSHIINRSKVGAVVHLDKLPLSQALKDTVELESARLLHASSGGDDYELLFTVPEEHRVQLETALSSYHINATQIGQITGAVGKVDTFVDGNKVVIEKDQEGYQHF